jgi:hypothetical protein
LDTIEKVAQERSGFFIKIDFYDEFDTAFVPTTLHWKLTDKWGNVMNSRSDVEVTVGLASSMYITLGASDLTTIKDAMAARILTVWGTYTSTIHGAGQTFRRQALFNIEPEVGGTV